MELLKRVEKLSDVEVLDLLGLLGTIDMHEQTRDELNKEVVEKIESYEIDEVELLIIESGN